MPAAAKPFTTINFADGSTWENPYKPGPRQKLYHESLRRYILYGGARGGGKTRAEVEDIAGNMLEWPGLPILLFRKDLQDLKRTVLREWLLRVPPILYDPVMGGQWHKAENYIRLFNGSILYLSEMKDPESWRSATLAKIYGDEFHEVLDPEKVLQELNATLRWQDEASGIVCTRQQCAEDARRYNLENREHFRHPPRQIKLASNPHGGYLKKRFYLPYKEGREEYDTQYIPAQVFDNPGVDASYIAGLMRNNPQWVRNFVYGDWDAFENMAYPSFNRGTHLWRKPIPWNQVQRICGGIDWGSTGTESHLSAMYLTAQLRTGEYVTFEEYTEQGAPSKILFAKIREWQDKYHVSRWWADASQFIANNHLSSTGIPVSDAPRHQGAVKDGVNVGERLMQADATGRPGWYYTENCERLAVGLESYSVDPDTGQYIKRDDDEVDAWRYGIMGMVDRNNHVPASQQITVVNPGGIPRHQRHSSSILTRRREERQARFRAFAEFVNED
jgi:hypothetical protein